MRLEVLGPLRVVDRREIAVTRPSHRRLLAILALEANRSIPTETIIDRFWRDGAPPTARASLQMHVTALRRVLGRETVVTESGAYRLDLAKVQFDVDELQETLSSARQAARGRDWETALERADAGRALWRGDPYPDLADDSFARGEARRLEEIQLFLDEQSVEALLELDRADDALPILEGLIAAHPLRERLWELLMRARYRVGRHAEALEAYRDAWATFAEIGIEPSAGLRRLEQEILLHDESLGVDAPNNLPVELTAFVGREREVDEVLDLLDTRRLVTLTGVGGGGKTRLALRVAARALSLHPDGCWLAELAPVRDAGLVSLELADAIGLRPQGDEVLPTLASALGESNVLVVLDNCEHVLASAAALSHALLEAGPRVVILATSREPLRVPGEVVYEVPPMPFPDDDADASIDFDALRLFEERAVHARPSFVLDAAKSRAVAHICRRLDGIPLAIELAAARVGSMTPEEIVERLDDRFRLLTSGSSIGPERHQTLEATFDWSYDLLDGPEQRLLARLAIFRGSFALDAAELVCAGDGIASLDVVPLLTALADKSLVTSIEAGTTTRYRLLETVRQYAHRRLEESGELEAQRMRHGEWCVSFAAAVVASVHGAGRWELFERLDAESDNLQAAVEDAQSGPVRADIGMLTHALAWNALDLGHLDRCAELLRVSIDLATDTEEEALRRSLLGTALFLSGDGDRAFEESERATELVTALDSTAASVPVLTAFARFHLLLLDRDPSAAIPLSRRALEIARETGDPFARIYAKRALGRALVWTGDADDGIEHYQAALDLALETGDRAMTLETYESYFVLLYLHPRARRSEPRRIAEEMLALFPSDERRWGRYTPADWLPQVYLQSGEWERAHEEIERIRARHLEGWDRTGYLVYSSTLLWMRGALDDARRRLAELETSAVDPSWYHEYYPLVADIAAEERRLADVRAAADAYLSFRAHRSEEAKKLAVLSPLARAEADAALIAPRRDRANHVRRARAAVERGRRILETSPPLTRGSLQPETPWTYLALAEAELARAAEPDPGPWRAVVSAADTAWLRLYARFRLAEALYEVARPEDAESELRSAHAEACRIGAGRLRADLEQLAAREDVLLEAGERLAGKPPATRVSSVSTSSPA